MEHEGLVRALEFLSNKSVDVSTLVTDRHKQICKYVRKTHPDINHRYDIWHVSKGNDIILYIPVATFKPTCTCTQYRHQEEVNKIS